MRTLCAIAAALLIAGCATTSKPAPGTTPDQPVAKAEPVFETRPPVDASTLAPEQNVKRQRIEMEAKVTAKDGEAFYRDGKFDLAVETLEKCLAAIRSGDAHDIPLDIGDLEGRIQHMLNQVKKDRIEAKRQRELSAIKAADAAAGN